MLRRPERLPPARRLVLLLIVGAWIVLAGVLLVRYVLEARQQAHLQLTQVLLEDKPDAKAVLAAFDSATEYVIAVAFVPWAIFSCMILLLGHQTLKFKSRCELLQQNLHASLRSRVENISWN